MSVSIKDIAKITGFSSSTVSRVLCNNKNISEETRQIVQKAAEQYNYVPNMVARSLISKKTNTIGVIIPDISESYFARIIKGIDQAISAEGYTMILCDSSESAEKEDKLIGVLSEKRVDGIIIATVQPGNSLSENPHLKNIPVVFIDNIWESFSNFNFVTLNNAKASYLAVEHLSKLGHKKIAGIFGKQNESTGLDRHLGFVQALDLFGIPFDERLVKIGDFKEESAYNLTMELLSGDAKPTAIYASSSKMTYGAILAILKCGLKIPQDISLVGFDVRDEYRIFSPSITTILQPEHEMGNISAELLLKLIDGDNKNYNQKITIEPILRLLDSSAKYEEKPGKTK